MWGREGGAERGREGRAVWGREGGAVRGAPGIRRDERIGKKSSRIRCLLIVLCHSHLMENRRARRVAGVGSHHQEIGHNSSSV